jgi:hypothetical protein
MGYAFQEAALGQHVSRVGLRLHPFTALSGSFVRFSALFDASLFPVERMASQRVPLCHVVLNACPGGPAPSTAPDQAPRTKSFFLGVRMGSRRQLSSSNLQKGASSRNVVWDRTAPTLLGQGCVTLPRTYVCIVYARTDGTLYEAWWGRQGWIFHCTDCWCGLGGGGVT